MGRLPIHNSAEGCSCCRDAGLYLTLHQVRSGTVEGEPVVHPKIVICADLTFNFFLHRKQFPWLVYTYKSSATYGENATHALMHIVGAIAIGVFERLCKR